MTRQQAPVWGGDCHGAVLSTQNGKEGASRDHGQPATDRAVSGVAGPQGSARFISARFLWVPQVGWSTTVPFHAEHGVRRQGFDPCQMILVVPSANREWSFSLLGTCHKSAIGMAAMDQVGSPSKLLRLGADHRHGMALEGADRALAEATAEGKCSTYTQCG